MAALVADRAAERAEKVAVVWREVRCRNKWCRTLLFRYRVPLVASDPGRIVTVEWVCPDRRCRRAQTVVLPGDGEGAGS